MDFVPNPAIIKYLQNKNELGILIQQMYFFRRFFIIITIIIIIVIKVIFIGSYTTRKTKLNIYLGNYLALVGGPASCELPIG